MSGVGTWVRYIADGHSSTLFATLAGFSLMLMAGRMEPKTGLAGRQAMARIAIRAVVLVALGTGLAMAFGDAVIIGFYGVYFLVCMPLLRLSGRTLAIIAVGLALVTPQLAFVLKAVLSESVQQSINAYDPLEKLSGVGVIDLLVTGFYPTIPWMSFVVAGMALARFDLSDTAVRRRLAAFGAAITAAAYGLALLWRARARCGVFRRARRPAARRPAGRRRPSKAAGPSTTSRRPRNCCRPSRTAAPRSTSSAASASRSSLSWARRH